MRAFCPHDSKQESTKHSADRDKASIKAIQGRASLMKWKEGGITTVAEEKLEKKLARVWKQKKHKRQWQSIPSGVCRAAVTELVKRKSNPNIQVYTTETQTDQVLAKLVINGLAGAILSNDGDFPVHLGGTGVSITKATLWIHSFKWFHVSSVKVYQYGSYQTYQPIGDDVLLSWIARKSGECLHNAIEVRFSSLFALTRGLSNKPMTP